MLCRLRRPLVGPPTLSTTRILPGERCALGVRAILSGRSQLAYPTEATSPPDPNARRTNTVIVGPLASHVDKARLEAAFSACGTVVSARVKEDVVGDMLLRYGYIAYDRPLAVGKAARLDGMKLGGQPLYVRALWKYLDTIHVRGLDWSADEAKLRDIFENCGEI